MKEILVLLILIIAIIGISGCTDSTKEFKVGDSTFQLSGDWEEGFKSEGGGKLQRIRLDTATKGILMTEYFNKSEYLIESENAVENVTISGIQCKKVPNVMTYFFVKNGKYYMINVHGVDMSGTWINAEPGDIKFVEEIIRTLQ